MLQRRDPGRRPFRGPLVLLTAFALAAVTAVPLVGCKEKAPEGLGGKRPRVVLSTPAPGQPAPPAQGKDGTPGPRLRGVAEKVRKDVGEVGEVSEGGGPWVAVFDETHISRIGQVEIALMLYRLYRDHGLRHIALEGYTHDHKADASWFHDDKLRPATPTERKLVATQLLAEGEISAAEYMALLFPQAKVHPIEDPRQYAVTLPEKASGAAVTYLIRIALKSLNYPRIPEPHASRIAELQKAKKDREVMEYLLGADPWVAEKFKLFRDQDRIIQADQWGEVLSAIEKKAQEVGAELQPADREAMAGLKKFFATAHERSKTMVAATAKLTDPTARPAEAGGRSSPTAMIIGAAHTSGVCKDLASVRLPYAVISPRSLRGKPVKSGNMTLVAFARKDKKLSVDEAGLGRLLDGRKPEDGKRKPPPVISEPWLQAKADLYLLCDRIGVWSAGKGGQPPEKDPPFGLRDDQLKSGHVRVVPGTMRREGNEVVFQAELFAADEAKKLRLWARTRHVAGPVKAEGDLDVEVLLKELWERMTSDKEKSPRIDPKADAMDDRKTTTPVTHVSSQTIAKFSQDPATLRNPIGTDI